MLVPHVGVSVALHQTHLLRQIFSENACCGDGLIVVWDCSRRRRVNRGRPDSQRREDFRAGVKDVQHFSAVKAHRCDDGLVVISYSCNLVSRRMESIGLNVRHTSAGPHKEAPLIRTLVCLHINTCSAVSHTHRDTHSLLLSTLSRARSNKAALENSHLMDWTWRRQHRQIP